MPSLSVVIPALNEESVVGETVRRTIRQGPRECIVVDGGSGDATVREAETAGARVLQAGPGRGVQMNVGARAATGDALLFLHADTHLPADGVRRVQRALQAPGVQAGIFRLRFDAPTPLLRFYAACTALPWIRLAFGDRGLFVDREAFWAVGGFPEWPLFEDLELAHRLHAHGAFRFLPAAVTTSARRFHRNGTVRQQLLNLYLWLHYCAGTDPHQLADWYEYSG